MSAPTRVAPKAVRLAELFDVRTITFFVGLVIGGAGGCMLSIPWTLVAIGSVLTFKAVR